MSKFLDTAACRLRLACKDCRGNAAWRKAMGAPEVCPRVVEDDLARREKICLACPLLRQTTCCGCSEARQFPWKELSVCKWHYWDEEP